MKKLHLTLALVLLGLSMAALTGCPPTKNSTPTSPNPMPTNTITDTPTITYTATLTGTPTLTATVTRTFTATLTPTTTATSTSTPTVTSTATATSTATPCSGVFGSNSSYPSIGGNPDGLFFIRIQASQTTSLVSLSMEISGGTTFQMGMYADNGGSPGSLLADTGPQADTTGLNKATLSTPLALVNGTYYWLAFHTDGNFYGQAGGSYPLAINPSVPTFGPLPDGSTAYDQGVNQVYQAYGTTCP